MIFALSKPDRTLKILGFMTTVLLWSSTLPAMPELPHHNDSDKFLGIETCGSSTCHGSPEPWRNATVLMKERILWEHSDPHSDAYETLQSNRAKSIANKLNLKKATSSEFDKNGLPIIGLINEWTKDGKKIKGTDKDLGGTMRLGSYDAKLKENSQIRKIYKSKLIKERHRHRYEVNIAYKDKFEKKGMIFSGLSPDNKLPEIVELKNHPWFIGVQFHPEFKSRPLSPHPLFSSFIKAAKNRK